MRHGVVKAERVRAERGSSLIAFDGKEWRKVIRLGDTKIVLLWIKITI